MTETTNETRTVQNYRHAARRQLKAGREALALRTDETREVYNLLNGAIEGVIQGRTGLSQEEQVQHLDEALSTLKANLETLPEKVAAARDAVLAQIDGWEASITEQANAAVSTLEEAKEFAATRDFEAWQEEKRRKRERGYGYADTSEDFEDDEDDDEDDNDL